MERDNLDAIYDAMMDIAAGAPGSGGKCAFLEALCRARYGRYAEEAEASDAIFFQAEGTMTGTDIVRGVRLLLLPFVAKHVWGKPVYAFNHTIFICDDRFAKIAAAVFNTFDFNAVRESISLPAARGCGMGPVYHIPDTAFLTRPAPDDRLPDLQDDYFAVTGSALPQTDIHDRLFVLADAVRRATGLKPAIAASAKADRRLIELAEIHWHDGGYAIIPDDVGYSAVAHALSQCAFLLGGRYHLTILAASVGTPAIQVPGNTYKNEGLSAMLGGLSPVRSVSDTETVVTDARHIVDNAEALRQQLADSRDAIARSLESARAWLGDSLAGRSPSVPDSFVSPPGVPITDYRAHLQPYCSLAVAQARTLGYSENPRAAMGEPPNAANVLPAIADSCLAGEPDALAMLRQLAASYPDIQATLRRTDHPLHGLIG